MMSYAALFSAIRASVFNGHLRQRQVDGINSILAAWDASPHTDPRWLAYMLGTTYHETAATMQPIREFGSTAYLTRMYDIRGRRPDTARRMGNTRPGDGPRYCGRGYVQLTWRANYIKLGNALGVDLDHNPDLAMQPDIAAQIMLRGMTECKISFTGKILSDYFNNTVEDWHNARRVINALDHAAQIAETAQDFYAALAARDA